MAPVSRPPRVRSFGGGYVPALPGRSAQPLPLTTRPAALPPGAFAAAQPLPPEHFPAAAPFRTPIAPIAGAPSGPGWARDEGMLAPHARPLGPLGAAPPPPAPAGGPAAPEDTGLEPGRVVMTYHNGQPVYYGSPESVELAKAGLARVGAHFGVHSREYREAAMNVLGIIRAASADPYGTSLGPLPQDAFGTGY